MPGGLRACQLYGVLTVAPLVLSVETYALIAYERYKALVRPLDVLPSLRLMQLWSGSVALALFVAIVPFFGLGGYRVKACGLYCLVEDPASMLVVLFILSAFLLATVVFYTLTGTK